VELFKPRGAGSIRRPTTDEQNNGQIVNPPRYAHFGGLSKPSKIGGKDHFAIKKPGDGHKVV
jgi:hypothetical protein